LRPFAAWVVLLLAVGAALPVDAAPEGQITWASHVTLVPAWFGYQGWAEKKYRNLIQGGSSRFGNAATRMEQLLMRGGIYAHGSYPDIDGLFREQARELDRKRREAAVHRIQQLVYDNVVVAPIYEVTGLNGVGPRVGEAGLGSSRATRSPRRTKT
jgi:ABC-type transport system substrate-binding protein